MRFLRLLAIPTLFISLIAPRQALANVIFSWDWNDGTTQGWTASMNSGANDANTFKASNAGNGSLQFTSRLLPANTLMGLSTVTFDLSILEYSTVSSPGQLAFAVLSYPSHPNRISGRCATEMGSRSIETDFRRNKDFQSRNQ